jgi:hypothetical protein
MKPAWETTQQLRRELVFIFQKPILACGNWRAAYIKFGCATKKKNGKQWKIQWQITMIVTKYWGI